MAMPISHMLAFALMNFGTGITVPVLSLLLMARGATLETLPLVMGVTLVVTVALEVPSGVAADVLGRRRLFVCSMVLGIAVYVLLALGVSVWLVVVSSVLRGIALAARTGTLESIEVDRVMAAHANNPGLRLSALDKLNSMFTVLETVGVGAGALAGGVLATLDASYLLVIAAVCVVNAGALVVALLVYPRDECRACSAHAESQEGPRRPSVGEALHQIIAAIKDGGTLKMVLLASAAAGVVLLTVETYRQPALLALAGDGMTWLLGPVSCAGQAAAALGSVAASRMRGPQTGGWGAHGRSVWMLGTLAGAVLMVVVLGAATVPGLFVAAYVALYLLLGVRTVFEQTLLREAAPSQERTGMMSIQSIALRAGGLVATGVSSVVTTFSTLACLWPALALVAAVPSVLAAVRMWRM